MAKQIPVPAKFTDTKRVKELIELMATHDLTELELVEDKSKITLKRGSMMVAAPQVVSHGVTHAVHAAPTAGGAAASAPVAEVAENLVPIKSPMVGTYYAAASPESGPFVSVGSSIGNDTVVCIIEAMKVFNEIRAETSGTIVKILIQNGQSLEFGQPMFLVKPN